MIWHYKLMVNFLRLWTTLLYNHKVEIYKAPLVPSRLLWFILRSRVEGQIREDWGWMSTSYESLMQFSLRFLVVLPSRYFSFIWSLHYAQYLDNFNLSKLKSQNIWVMKLTKQESTKELDVIDPMYLMNNAI